MKFVASRWGIGLLWLTAAVVTVTLALLRYRSALAGGVGGDFSIYFHSGQLVAAGKSPYQSSPNYVYPPVIALALAPFTHIGLAHVWRAWTALQLVALVAGVSLFVGSVASRLASWQLPVVFLGCSITVLHFWPTTMGLSLGQSDAFVFAAVAMSTWAASRSRLGLRGVLLGAAGLLKAWPAAAGAVLLQRGLVDRKRALVAFAVTLVVAPIVAVAFGGGSGLASFGRNLVNARSQPLVSGSVWGAPNLLFSRTGLARPLVISVPLHAALVSVLMAWVVALVVLALRTAGDPIMCTWNVMFCSVLLLPVSHLAYALYGLPVLWIWGVRLLEARRFEWRGGAVVALLALWWLVQTKAWPDTGSSPAISSTRFVIPFAANLMACTASVVGAWLASRTPTDHIGSGGHLHEDQEDESVGAESVSRADRSVLSGVP